MQTPLALDHLLGRRDLSQPAPQAEQGRGAFVWNCAASPDGTRVVAAGGDQLKILDASTFEEVRGSRPRRRSTPTAR